MFEGTGVAIITPFKNDYEIDYESLKKIVDFQIEGGVEYLVFLGTTGESVTLSSEEKTRILEFARKAVNGRVPLVVGMGGNNTIQVTESIRNTSFEGIDGILSVCPYYNKPGQDGIYNHYKAIADQSPVPVILYNVPGRTGVNMSASTTLRLAHDVKNIKAMKEASGDFEQCMEIIRQKPSDFAVISGEDALSLPLLSTGMSGVISVAANAFPAEFSTMVRRAIQNEYDKARELHYQLLPLMKLMFADGSPGGVKALMAEMNLCKNVVRPPLHAVKKEVEDAIKSALQEFKSEQ